MKQSNDPLLQSFQLKHLTLRNRLMSTAHEPYTEGEVDQAAFIAHQPQTLVRAPANKFQAFRIGDAVAPRNIRVAIYDAVRVVMGV